MALMDAMAPGTSFCEGRGIGIIVAGYSGMEVRRGVWKILPLGCLLVFVLYAFCLVYMFVSIPT